MDSDALSSTLQPPPSPPLLSATPRWTKERPPGVNDVRNKVCWICREEEVDEGSRRRKWVHPCGCSLVAHQSCLLLWMTMQHNDEMKCPQCKVPFEVISPPNRLLSVLEWVNKAVGKVARVGSVIVLTSSIMGLFTFYGHQSLKWFVGRDVAALILGGTHPREWHLRAWVQLPLIPLSLLLAQTRAAFIPVIPFILAAPLPAPQTTDLIVTYPLAPPLTLTLFPPSPPLLLALVPFVRHVYRKAHTRVVHWLIRDRLLSPPQPANQNQTQNQNPNNDDDDFDQNVRDFAARELDRNEPITVDMDVIARTFFGGLMLPPLSALLGEGLRMLSGRWGWLEVVLGVKRTGMAGAGRFAGLNLDGAFVPAGLAEMVKIGLGVRRKTYADFDPVWWRNAIGLGCFFVLRDAFNLWRKYLTVNNDKKRMVANKPFVNMDYGELDLIIEDE